MVFYPGGIISSNPVKPSTSSASGLWSITEQLQASYTGIWPATSAAVGSINATMLIVAGGGGGGGWLTGSNYNGGGGGAGGLVYNTNTPMLLSANYTIVVGAGGTGGPGSTAATNGSNSSITGFSINYTAIGGGAGGSSIQGQAGGSGGGATGTSAAAAGGLSIQNSTFGYGLGNAGGANPGSFLPGGGGGSANAGGTGSSTAFGGVGSGYNFANGTTVYYAGGGSGGSVVVAGNLGGGGASGGTGSNGNTSSGGGGGGSLNSPGNGGAGGSGTVILSYPLPQYYTGGIVTNNNGTNVVHTFNTSSSLTALTTPIDTYQPYNTLLVHADGTNGANNSVFLDSSTNNLSITKTGTPTQGTFSPFATTGWSNYFNGTTDYITVNNTGSINLSSGNFTIECWVYPTTTISSTKAIITKDWTSGSTYMTWGLYTYVSGFLTFTIGSGTSSSAGAQDFTSSYTPPANSWTHLAVVKSGTTITIYANGTNVYSATQTGTIGGSTNNIRIGADNNPANYFPGYISNVRVLQGTVLYTGNFIPPSNQLTTSDVNTQLLTSNTNRFIGANSTVSNTSVTTGGTPQVQPFSPFNPTSAYSIANTGGSFYLNGTSDYLTIPYTSQFDFISGSALSFEAWVYPTSYTNPIFLANRNWSYGGSGPTWGFRIANATNIDWDIAGTGSATYVLLNSTTLVAPYNIPLNAWTHVAFTRDNAGNNKIFVNGYLVAARTDSQTLAAASGPVYIGIPSSGGNYTQSYISNMRLVSNNIPTSYQTSSTTIGTQIFTPPTLPFKSSSTANTTLLLNATNAGIIDNTQKVNLISYGSAAISTTQSKFGGTSVFFNGTTDYIQGTVQAPGTSDFTLEGWVNFSSVPATGSSPTFFSIIGTSSSNGFQPYATTSGWGIRNYTQNILGITGGAGIGTAPSVGTWYHVAIVRYSGTISMYINGVSAGSTSTAYTFSDTTFSAGWCATGSTGVYFNGYVDEIRYTKSYARYTSNFIPQTSAFLNT